MISPYLRWDFLSHVKSPLLNLICIILQGLHRDDEQLMEQMVHHLRALSCNSPEMGISRLGTGFLSSKVFEY